MTVARIEFDSISPVGLSYAASEAVIAATTLLPSGPSHIPLPNPTSSRWSTAAFEGQVGLDNKGEEEQELISK